LHYLYACKASHEKYSGEHVDQKIDPEVEFATLSTSAIEESDGGRKMASSPENRQYDDVE
jgi:hypothetical protein